MRAARFHGPGDVRVEDVPVPGPIPPGWVRVRVEACGICGTDMEEYRDGPMLIPTSPHPLTGRQVPLTMGHEVIGWVDAVGADVDDDLVGTRVAVDGTLSCGRCWWCRRGEDHLCPDYASLGIMADGGLAEQVLAPATQCVPLSATVPVEVAALAEPLAVAVRAARRGGVTPGDAVVVVGCGSVGLLLVQVLHRLGARAVIGVDPSPARRDLALRHGATHAVDPAVAAATVRAATEGIGADVTIEVAGVPTASTAAVRLARRGGTAVLLGAFDAPLAIDMLDLLMGEKTVTASLSHQVATDFTEAVALLDAGHISADGLVTDVIGLDDVAGSGFAALRDAPAAHLKIIVRPDLDGAGARVPDVDR